MRDIADVIDNLQTLTVNDSSFKVLKDFERVLDELDLYVFKNWEDGELIEGPNVSRYMVTCKFMWPREDMPDPKAGARLLDYGCHVKFQKDNILVPRKVYEPGDFRPGTKKGKIDAHPIWIVEVSMPKKLMQDIYQGYADKDNQAIADMMRYDQPESLTAEAAAQDTGEAAPVEAPPTATPGGITNAPAQA
jgi:hypothetical protein